MGGTGDFIPGLLVCIFYLLPYLLLDQVFFLLKQIFPNRLNNIDNDFWIGYSKNILYISFQFFSRQAMTQYTACPGKSNMPSIILL